MYPRHFCTLKTPYIGHFWLRPRSWILVYRVEGLHQLEEDVLGYSLVWMTLLTQTVDVIFSSGLSCPLLPNVWPDNVQSATIDVSAAQIMPWLLS